MKDLSSRRKKSGVELTPRHVLIGFLFLSVIGLVAILILFAGSVSISAGDTAYINGKITTTVNCDTEDPLNVWVQHMVYRENGIFDREQIGDSHAYTQILHTGENIIACPVALTPGIYKVFIYISSVEENPRRLAGITKTIEVS